MKHLFILLLLSLSFNAASAASLAEVDSLFAWAEINYPALFKPASQASQSALGYYYRYYPQSDSYLGFREDDQGIYYLPSKGSVTPVGSVMPFLAQANTPPATPDALLEYLRGGVYLHWTKEAAIHTSKGPHGKVRTYFNPVLVDSLKANNELHPKDAAAIKELYNTDNQLAGWSVEVKTATAGADGADWYWYEVGAVTPGAQASVSGNGVTMCISCHAAGKDFVTSKLP